MKNRKLWLPVWGLFAASMAAAQSNVPVDLNAVFSFEKEHKAGMPAGWTGGPPATLGVDETVRHQGQWSGRIVRTNESSADFSTLKMNLPAAVDGSRLDFTAWVRSRNVDGNFGLWLRQDGHGGPVDFVNNYDLELQGDQDWIEISVSAELSEQAREIYFGVLLSGTGKVWIDDVQFHVDDKPYIDAPKAQRPVLPFESDTEFDNGSGISDLVVTGTQIEDIATLVEVWGFVKYHHPRVAAGEVHIDYELFRLLPGILNADNRRARNQVMFDWVRGLGPIESCTECASVPEDLHLQPQIDWIRDASRFGKELSSSLVSIYENRPATREHVFIALARGVRNAKFDDEPSYAKLETVDAGFRLLALARLWNIVQYWFPYRDLVDTPWKEVLRTAIPQFAAPLDADAYAREVIRVIVEIRDTHANLWNSLDARPPAGDCIFDAAFRFLEGEPVVWALSSPNSTSLEMGDVLLMRDGQTVDRLVQEWSPFYAASNVPTRLRDIGRNLSKGPCGESRIQVRRKVDGEEQTVELLTTRTERGDRDSRRWYTHDRGGDTYQELSGEVAYIQLSSIELKNVSEYVRRAQYKKGLVIDIRNYPGAFVVFELGQLLIATRQPFAKFAVPDLTNPGAFGWTRNMELEPTSPAFTGKVAILVDEVSQSQAEYTTMALRVSENAVVVGSTTAGADGNISRIMLPGGLQTIISGIGVFYPDGTPTQRVGIVPDIESIPTIEGIRAGRDEVLEAALRYILGEDATEEEITSLAGWP